MQTILFGRNFAGAHRILHARRGSHGILASHSDRVEPQGPSVADDPAVERGAPGGREHEETDEHDGGILNQTPSSPEPVADEADENLTANDTDGLEVYDSGDPVLCAVGVGRPPTILVDTGALEKRLEVADGEKHVALEQKAGSRDDSVAGVPANRAQRILLYHSSDSGQFSTRFAGIVAGDEADPLADRKIGPVDTVGIVTIVGTEQIVEDLPLVFRDIADRALSPNVWAMRRPGAAQRLAGDKTLYRRKTDDIPLVSHSRLLTLA